MFKIPRMWAKRIASLRASAVIQDGEVTLAPGFRAGGEQLSGECQSGGKASEGSSDGVVLSRRLVLSTVPFAVMGGLPAQPGRGVNIAVWPTDLRQTREWEKAACGSSPDPCVLSEHRPALNKSPLNPSTFRSHISGAGSL